MPTTRWDKGTPPGPRNCSLAGVSFIFFSHGVLSPTTVTFAPLSSLKGVLCSSTYTSTGQKLFECDLISSKNIASEMFESFCVSEGVCCTLLTELLQPLAKCPTFLQLHLSLSVLGWALIPWMWWSLAPITCYIVYSWFRNIFCLRPFLPNVLYFVIFILMNHLVMNIW